MLLILRYYIPAELWPYPSSDSSAGHNVAENQQNF